MKKAKNQQGKRAPVIRISIPEEIFQQVKEMAEKESRPLSNMGLILIRKALGLTDAQQ